MPYDPDTNNDQNDDQVDDWIDELDDLDPEGPSAADLERFGDEFVTCPVCGRAAYDQADQCHHCGAWLHAGPTQGVPAWVFVTVIAVLIAITLFWIF